MSVLKLSPIMTAVAAQLLALVILLATIQIAFHWLEFEFSLWVKLLFHIVIASFLTYFFRLAIWWIFIQCLVPVAVIIAIDLQFPAWLYAIFFFSFLLIFWNSAGERVPLYLTNQTTMKALGDLLNDQNSPVKFIDLGCGTGGTLINLAKRYPEHSFTGVETAPFPYLISKIRAMLSGRNNINIRHQNIWDVDLSNFQVCYAFLSPEPMPKLFIKVNDEMKLGSTFISNSFTPPDSPAAEIVKLSDSRQTKLHIWRF